MPLLGIPTALQATSMSLPSYPGPWCYNQYDGFIYLLSGGYGAYNQANKSLIKVNTSNWTYTTLVSNLAIFPYTGLDGSLFAASATRIIFTSESPHPTPAVTVPNFGSGQYIWDIDLSSLTATAIGAISGVAGNPSTHYIGNGYLYSGQYGKTYRIPTSTMAAASGPVVPEDVALAQPYPTTAYYDKVGNKLYCAVSNSTICSLDPDGDRFDYKILCGRYAGAENTPVAGPSYLMGMANGGKNMFAHQGYLYIKIGSTLYRYDLSQSNSQQLFAYGGSYTGPGVFEWVSELSMLVGFSNDRFYTIV